LVGQLERYQVIQKRRLEIWRTYHQELASWAEDRGVRCPEIPANCDHPAHMYHLRFPGLSDRSRFIDHLRSNGVLAVFHYQALHLSAVGKTLGGQLGQHPVTEEAADTLVRLPLHLDLKQEQLEKIISAVVGFK